MAIQICIRTIDKQIALRKGNLNLLRERQVSLCRLTVDHPQILFLSTKLRDPHLCRTLAQFSVETFSIDIPILSIKKFQDSDKKNPILTPL